MRRGAGVRVPGARMSATSIINACLAAMEQLYELRAYHSYLLQDPCANPRALAWVEKRISLFHNMSSRRSASIGSGELDGSQRGLSSPGHTRSNASRAKAIVHI